MEERQKKLIDRMKRTSTNLKTFEKIIKVKEEILKWFEFGLVIFSIIISLTPRIPKNVQIAIPIVTSIAIIYLGFQNYKLLIYKNRETYLAIDNLFSDVDSADKEKIIEMEKKYQKILSKNTNVPDFINEINHKKEKVEEKKKYKSDIILFSKKLIYLFYEVLFIIFTLFMTCFHLI